MAFTGFIIFVDVREVGAARLAELALRPLFKLACARSPSTRGRPSYDAAPSVGRRLLRAISTTFGSGDAPRRSASGGDDGDGRSPPTRGPSLRDALRKTISSRLGLAASDDGEAPVARRLAAGKRRRSLEGDATLEELQHTLRGAPLLAWARRATRGDVEHAADVLAAMRAVDVVIAPAVADDNVAAHYSSDAEGRFWRRFVAALPNYYEWLAVAADDDVATLRDAVGALIAHGVHEDAPGRSDAIIKEDRVAVARCLTLADGGLRRAFFSVVDAVAPTPHKAPDETPRGYDRGRRRGDMLFALRGDSHLDDELLKRTDSFELIDDDPSPRFPGAPERLATHATVPARVPSLIAEEPGERAPRRRSDPAAKRRASV